MELTVLERILVSRFIPLKGNYELLKVAQEFKPKLNFTEEESRKYDIEGKVVEGGRQMVTFNKDASDGYLVDIKFPPLIASHIARELKKLNDENELDESLIGIYEKFVL